MNGWKYSSTTADPLLVMPMSDLACCLCVPIAYLCFALLGLKYCTNSVMFSLYIERSELFTPFVLI